MNKDFNIDNYSINDLKNLFKINGEYSIEYLNNKENELITNITSNNNNNEYIYQDSDEDEYVKNKSNDTLLIKSELIQFIKKSKNKLILHLKSLVNENNIYIENQNVNLQSNNSNTPTPTQNLDFQNNKKENRINFVGTILNPLSNHPVLQKQSIINNEINGYNYNTTITNYVFNTQFRDNYFNSSSSNCTFTLPINIKNVISISLSACQFPNVIYGFSSLNQTNELFIHEDGSNLEAIVTIPEGNYTISNLAQTLEDNINLQVCGIPISSTKLNYRFFVTYNINTYLISIENIFYTFSMNILKKNLLDIDCKNQLYKDRTNLDYDTGKSCILPTQLFKTMGYIIGFREIEYFGKSIYTAESTFNNTYTSYVYFCLNEFNNIQQNTTYGIFPTCISDSTILALIPITSNPFTTTFDNNANFIYKTRVYGGPIDISKINIKILNQEGNLVDLHYRDYAFSLQVTSIYDITIPYIQS